MNFIDAHSHIWTPDTNRYPLAEGFRKEDMAPPSFTAEELQQHMKPVGVNRVVLIQMSFYEFDNSYMLDKMKEYPGMFSGVAVIDSEAPHPDREIVRLKKLGVRGFRIRPQTKNVDEWLDSDGMHTMFATGAREKLNMCCLINPNAIPALDRMCRDFPDTPVVIDHFARVGITGTIDPDELKLLCDLARHQNLTVKISAYYALGKKKPPYRDLIPMIRQVYNAYGAKRLMWASDSPFQVVNGHTYKASIDLVKNDLDFANDDDKEWLLRKTAERVFFQDL